MCKDLNSMFLEKIKESFKKYLISGSRSNEKLKILHGFIAECLEKELKRYKNGNKNYTIKKA